MKSSLAFDTLEFSDELKRGGIKQHEAEAITKATKHAFNQIMETKDFCTKRDLNELQLKLSSFIIKVITTGITVLIGFQTLLHFIGN